MNTYEIPARPARSIWFAILGAPLAWAAQGLIGWFVSARACAGDLDSGGARVAELVISIVALIVALAGVGIGLRAWRHSADSSIAAIRAEVRQDFLAAVALIVSVSFSLGIVWAALSAFLLPMCERMR
ncbi:hypothetical protein ACFPN2_31805 [Steroidobacter flavus]|uniref:MotA/TolQ/ExbB proton channel domain-containing protein n=1 Tax=Steroidobacter flavus TaxID=1842136 RepID=A0ABV8T1W2_9GAMM